jgi:hypothetical protein
MKKSKSVSKTTSKSKDLHIGFKYILLIVIAVLLSYITLLLKIQNYWSVIVNIALILLLWYNFRTHEGVLVIVSAMILSALTLPITVFSLSRSQEVQLIVFSVNMILVLLMALGLKHLTKWGLYLSIVVFAVSVVSLSIITYVYLASLSLSLFSVFALLKYLTQIIFYVTSVWFLLKHRKYFS